MSEVQCRGTSLIRNGSDKKQGFLERKVIIFEEISNRFSKSFGFLAFGERVVLDRVDGIPQLQSSPRNFRLNPEP